MSRLLPRLVMAAVMIVLSGTSPADTQTATTQNDREGVVTAVESAIRELYVFPLKSQGIIGALEQQRRAGRYDVADPGLIAQRLSEDLLAISQDHHLYLNYDPRRYDRLSQPPAAGESAGDAYEKMMALRDNSGLVAMTILPGNIRYLKISQFEWEPDATGGAYDDAMRFLRGGDALIIDLRGNPGGDAAAVRYLVSHFLDPDTLEYSFLEGTKSPVQMRALDYLPAGRLKGKPLYVLIDHGVASAAESFAYDVQQFKLGELVGEQTIGGANNNRLVPIPTGFILSVSYGRPVHAVSGTNWEGVGVTPSVPCAAVDALDEAQHLALLRLKDHPNADPAVSAEYDWALVGVESRLKPVTLSTDHLRSLAGHYGDIAIRFDHGQLWMLRSHRPGSRLSPLTAGDLFAVDGLDKLRVQLHRDRLDLLRQGNPAARTYPRDADH